MLFTWLVGVIFYTSVSSESSFIVKEIDDGPKCLDSLLVMSFFTNCYIYVNLFDGREYIISFRFLKCWTDFLTLSRNFSYLYELT